MGRISKDRMTQEMKNKKAARARAGKEPTRTGEAYSINTSENQFITNIKSQVLNLPYTHIIWLGAKDAGKTRPVVTRMVGEITTNINSYGLALKKYKTNATERLHVAVSNMAREMRMAGYDIPEVHKGQSRSFFMKLSPKYRELNQSIEYASLDDLDGIAGIEAPNNGLFTIVHIEEPVMAGDKEQPTHEEFWESIAILESSVNRSNRKYATINNIDPVFPTYHYTLNAWDDHPLVVEAEKIFPENDFLSQCLGVKNWQNLTIEDIDENWEAMKDSLVENNTIVIADKTTSKAFVRLTMFANPTWFNSSIVYNPKLEISKDEQVEAFWMKIKEAIIRKDYSSLAIYLGLKKQKSQDNKTYQTSLLRTADTMKMLKEEGWRILGTSQGWDVDINRLFCNTTVVLVERNDFLKGKELKLLVLPQESFYAYGDGGGRNIPKYKDAMVKTTNQMTGELYGMTMGKSEMGDYLFIDDDQGQWLQYFVNDVFHIKGKAKKRAEWSILNRQAWLNQAINSGFIIIDEDNKDLIREIKISVVSQSSDKRDESGGLNKNYDRLNSMEYAIYPFHHWINESIRLG